MTPSLTRTTTRIFGALSALGKGSPDLLQSLLPFFEPILRPRQGKIFEPETFAREIRETYRWNFNTDIVEVFVPRLTSQGWLTKNITDSDNSTYTITLPEDPPTSEELVAEQKLRDLATQFEEFSRELSPLTTIPLNVEDYEEILLEWLLYVEAFSEANIDFETTIRPDSTGKLRTIVNVPRTTSLTDEQIFLCARFVQHAIETDELASDVLSRIASIGLLTEVIQDFVKPQTPVEATNLVIFLDAPVAMELLGVSGRAARENTSPLVAELIRIGAKVNVFGQSIDEIRHSLGAVLQNPRPTGPTAQAIARGDVLREFVIAVADNPEGMLAKLGVGVLHRTLQQRPSEIAYFTDDDRETIFGSLTFQQGIHAREHDTDVTTLVMRQRRGVEAADLFKSRFVLVTRNGLLQQIVRKKCVEMGKISPSSVPPVVHRRVLAATIWLRTGLGAQDLALPKRILLSNCERVLSVNPGVVDAVKKFTDALGDDEKSRQLDILISQDRSTRMLMDKTLGAAAVVTESNVAELFEEMLHPHLEVERQRGESAVRTERERGREKITSLETELDTVNKEKSAAQKKLESAHAEDLAAISSLCEEVERTLRIQVRVRKLVAIILAFALCSIPYFFQGVWFSWLSVIPAIWLAYLTLTGGSIFDFRLTSQRSMEILSRLARSRGLEAKLQRVSVEWKDGRLFVID